MNGFKRIQGMSSIATFLSVLSIAILVAGAAIFFGRFQAARLEQEYIAKNTIEEKFTPEEERILSGWQTYTNNAYGYSFQYPEGWYIKSDKGDDALDSMILNTKRDFPAGAEVAVSNYRDALYTSKYIRPDDRPDDLVVVSLEVFEVGDLSLDEFGKKRFEGTWDQQLNKKYLHFNDLEGLRGEFWYGSGEKRVLQWHTLIKADGKVFRFFFSELTDESSLSKKSADILRLITLSFQKN